MALLKWLQSYENHPGFFSIGSALEQLKKSKVFCVRDFPNKFLDHSSKKRQELNPQQWSRYLWN